MTERILNLPFDFLAKCFAPIGTLSSISYVNASNLFQVTGFSSFFPFFSLLDSKFDSMSYGRRMVIKGQLWSGFGGTQNDIGSLSGFYSNSE
jgi:hypothetical protein